MSSDEERKGVGVERRASGGKNSNEKNDIRSSLEELKVLLSGNKDGRPSKGLFIDRFHIPTIDFFKPFKVGQNGQLEIQYYTTCIIDLSTVNL